MKFDEVFTEARIANTLVKSRRWQYGEYRDEYSVRCWVPV
jgi:hypothetical protein